MLRRSLLIAPLAAPATARAQAPAVRQDDVTAPGWRRGMLIRWGDRVTFDAPPFDPRGIDADGAAAQFGWDARVIGIATPPRAADGVERAVLAAAHPRVDALAFPGGRDRPEVAGAMGGASLLNLERQGDRGWVVVDGGFQARRLTATTLCRIGAEAARGLAGIQGGCVTPWGTLLLAEGESATWSARLALPAATLGWLAELDPFDPQSVPAKRAACGRLPLRGDAAAAVARDGRAVVFQTHRASPGGMLFRFVSAGPASAPDSLEAGTLSVALAEGGRLRFAELPPEAAREPVGLARGAAAFDAPSGLAYDARANRLLLAVRGGAGTVLALRPEGGDAGAQSWALETLAQGTVPAPDTVTPDPRSARVFVGTDGLGTGGLGIGGVGMGGVGMGGAASADTADALWLLEAGRATPLYAAARGAAVGGAAVTPDGATVIAAARMPGRGPDATFERPATRWPEFQPGVPPRSALVSLTR